MSHLLPAPPAARRGAVSEAWISATYPCRRAEVSQQQGYLLDSGYALEDEEYDAYADPLEAPSAQLGGAGACKVVFAWAGLRM